jgi:murein L,D-transpeptidase YcbB/YkuD
MDYAEFAKRPAVAIFCLCLLTIPALADDAADSEALRVEIEQLRETGMLSIGGIDIATGNVLAEFYERRNFRPTWTDNDQVKELLELALATRDDGLNPRDYHAVEIEKAIRALDRGQIPTPLQRAAVELLFTDSLLRLAYHQLYGRLDPTSLDPRWNFESRPMGPDPLSRLQEAIDSPSLNAYVDELFVRAPLYQRLRDALRAHRQIEADGGWSVIPQGKVLKTGISDSRVPALAERLATTGDLAETPAGLADLYSEEVADGVRSFQARHGLDVDGAVGPATLAALNVPAATRIDQLRVNLERARWVTGGLGNDFVIVNIAGFRAYLVKEGQIAWETRVQVGRSYHQTPVFRDSMTYVVMNPTWTVPYSIATKEMLPKIQRDPDYFKTREFDVRNREGQNVDPETIDFSQLSRGNFPYTFVQRAGPGNALGRIKFIFPNKHSVYLHDTPSKSLFERSERAFSHGCIRTQNPFDLAERLLEPAGWDRARIDAQVDSLETKTVHLAEPLPVLLLYWTADIGADGEYLFYNDIYQRDQRVLAGLDAPFHTELPIDLAQSELSQTGGERLHLPLYD